MLFVRVEAQIHFQLHEIWYTDEKSQRHRYFSDIFIPHKNLIIEVKSTWTYEKGMKQGKLVLQREACLRAGYDYKYMVYTDLGKEYFPSDLIN